MSGLIPLVLTFSIGFPSSPPDKPTPYANIWDVAADFSSTENPHRDWTFGGFSPWIPPPYDPTTFAAFPERELGDYGPGWTSGFGWGQIWKNTSDTTVFGVSPGQVSIHPGPEGEASVVRWTAPQDFAATVAITGTFWAGDMGSERYTIAKNGAAVWSHGFTTDSVSFALLISISGGEVVDFSAEGTYSYGDSPLDAYIMPCNQPIIALHPGSQSVAVGEPIVFTVATSGGDEPLAYQWRHNGQSLTDDERIQGAQSAELLIETAQLGDAGVYDVVIANCFVVTSNPAALVVGSGGGADCNDNGVPDALDIANGTSLDCNGDSIPDECQLYDISLLSLGDVVVGGDTLGSGIPGAGLDPRTGAFVPPDVFAGEGGEGPMFIRTDGNYGTANLPFVDGVFIPNGVTPIDSTGGTFEFAETSGTQFDAVRNSISVFDGDANPPHAWPIRLGDEPGTDRVGLGMHANVGVTFDLAAIHAAHGSAVFSGFAAQAGLSEEVAGSGAAADIWVLVDGVVRFHQLFSDSAGLYAPVAVPLYPTDHFLTLASTDAGSLTADHAVFADAYIGIVLGDDCNNNGVPDECDIASGTSTDINNNDIPDECEGLTTACCHGDGVCTVVAPLACVTSGGIPLGAGTTCEPNQCPNLLDCNHNGIPDSLDIVAGFSPDCNVNGVPDECETDSDDDGVIDACDECPNDPLKTAPGECGCGVADADTDGDGVLDCLDGCPNDPLKTAPGPCGCGQTETDTDGDGVPDCIDNCPNVYNPDQADSNGNGIGDACDDGQANHQPPGSISPFVQGVTQGLGGETPNTGFADAIARLGSVLDGLPGNTLLPNTQADQAGRTNPGDSTYVSPDQLEQTASGLGLCPASSGLMIALTLAGLGWSWRQGR